MLLWYVTNGDVPVSNIISPTTNQPDIATREVTANGISVQALEVQMLQ
jgi:hypothetical protein